MINLYNKHYVKTMNKYKNIMDTICTITLTKLPTQTEASIFKIKCLPTSRVFTDDVLETSVSSIMFLREDLENACAINNSVKFPIDDINNRIQKIRFNGYSFVLDSKQMNGFDNVITLNVVNKG